MNNRIHLLTKEDIERFGFVYEPDATKCKTGKIKVFYSGFHQKDGKITPQPFRREWDQFCPEEQYKEFIARAIYLKYVNDVFVIDPEPIPGMDGFHGDVWVMISGHTRIKSKGEEEYEDEELKRMHEEILKEIELEKSKMSKWQRFKKWIKNWAYFGGF